MLSQMNDIPAEQFCNGDNRPPNCGANCMCTHTVDIPLNAIVEVVLVDEGRYPYVAYDVFVQFFIRMTETLLFGSPL